MPPTRRDALALVAASAAAPLGAAWASDKPAGRTVPAEEVHSTTGQEEHTRPVYDLKGAPAGREPNPRDYEPAYGYLLAQLNGDNTYAGPDLLLARAAGVGGAIEVSGRVWAGGFGSWAPMAAELTEDAERTESFWLAANLGWGPSTHTPIIRAVEVRPGAVRLTYREPEPTGDHTCDSVRWFA